MLYEMDLDEEEISGFARALDSGDAVLLGGRLVRWEQAQALRIARSESPWQQVYQKAEADLARRGRADLRHAKQWYVFDTCEDVTRSVLSQARTASGKSASTPDPRQVFVVHGRNLQSREALFQFLTAINLHPIEFTEALAATGKPNPYIGEILEKAFSLAQAIVVLMTPDDQAQLRTEYLEPNDPEYEKTLTAQARPNVLFEAGMAMGRDPNRTVLVQLGEVRPFSDVAGRHILRMDDSSQSRQQLADRLDNAGCDVQLRGTRWHEAGAFAASIQGLATPREGPSDRQGAQLRAYMDKDLDSSGRVRHLLVVENIGPGEATDIRAIVDDVPVTEHNAIVALQGEITQIGPLSRCHYVLSLTMDSPIPSKVSLTWLNESGEEGHYSSTLSL